MNYSSPHTALSLQCMKHVLGELIPFAKVVDEYHNGVVFTLVFTVNQSINDSFIPHLENRQREISKKVLVREMIEGNAKEYLHSLGEKKLAEKLSSSGKELLSILTLCGNNSICRDEISKEVWPTKILQLEEFAGKWYLVGMCRQTLSEIEKSKAKCNSAIEISFQRRGEHFGYFTYSTKGTVWLESGLEAIEALRKSVREIYRPFKVYEKRYAENPLREVGAFSLIEKNEPIFPKNRCFGDVGYLAYDKADVKKIFSATKEFLILQGFEVEEKKNFTLFVKDVFGIAHKMSEIKVEQGKQGPLARISLIYSLERACALLLELAPEKE